MEELLKVLSTGADAITYLIVYMLYRHDNRLTIVETIMKIRRHDRDASEL